MDGSSPNDLYLHLVDHLPDGIAIHVDGVVVFANRAAAAIMGGAGPADLIGRPAIEFVHPDDREVVMRRIARIVDGGEIAEALEERYIRLDGEIIDVEVRAMPVVFGGRPGVQVIVRDVTKSRRDQRALESSERKLRAIFEASTEAIAINSALDGRYLEVNPRWEAMSGYSRSEVVGHTAKQVGTWLRDDERRGLARAIARGERIINHEAAFRSKSGETVWVLFSAIRVDLDGVPCVLSFGRDISDRKQAQQAFAKYAEDLARSRAQLAEAQAIAHVGSWELDVATQAVQWSDETFRIFGLEPGDGEPTLARSLDIIVPADREGVAAYLRALTDVPAPRETEFRILRTDGVERVLVAQGRRIEGAPGSGARLVGTVQDVTDRKAAERALRESDERFRQLAENTTELFWIANPDLSRFFYLSPAFESVWGLTAEAVNQDIRQFYSLVPAEGRAAIADAITTLKQGRPKELDLRIVRDGASRWLWVRCFPVLDESGNVHRIAGLTVDVTERKQLEAELRSARDAALEADRLKSAFLANMSHEIRTPLNVIMGFASFVGEHLAEIGDHSQDRCFEGINKASKRLLATINGIVDLSRFEAKGFEMRPTTVDLPALLLRLLREFEPAASEKGVRLASHVESHAIVRFDEYCLTQALTHLIDNAVKFTERGSVTVRLRRLGDGALTLEVSDTGVGIDPKFLPRLFHSFAQEDMGYTRRFEGSGLGLALVRRYLELNGATITCESQKGVGSTFRIRFPGFLSLVGGSTAGAGSAAADRGPAPEPAFPAPRPVVLVVEDDAVTQLFMKGLLERHCTVLLADGGEQCRRQLAAHGGEISVVLMDLSLSGDEDGLVLARAIRQDPATVHLPIIAVTAHVLDKDRSNALEAGCDDYVAKPVDPRELLAKMSRLIAREPSARRWLAR